MLRFTGMESAYALGGDDFAAEGPLLLGLWLPDRGCAGAGAMAVAAETAGAGGGAVLCADGDGSVGFEDAALGAERSLPNEGLS